MYSRYGGGIDRDDDFAPAAELLAVPERTELREEAEAATEAAARAPSGAFGGLFGGRGFKNPLGSLNGLFKGFNLKSLDTGDILLILILLLLFLEGEEEGIDWLIILGVVFFLGF